MCVIALAEQTYQHINNKLPPQTTIPSPNPETLKLMVEDDHSEPEEDLESLDPQQVPPGVTPLTGFPPWALIRVQTAPDYELEYEEEK